MEKLKGGRNERLLAWIHHHALGNTFTSNNGEFHSTLGNYSDFLSHANGQDDGAVEEQQKNERDKETEEKALDELSTLLPFESNRQILLSYLRAGRHDTTTAVSMYMAAVMKS